MKPLTKVMNTPTINTRGSRPVDPEPGGLSGDERSRRRRSDQHTGNSSEGCKHKPFGEQLPLQP